MNEVIYGGRRRQTTPGGCLENSPKVFVFIFSIPTKHTVDRVAFRLAQAPEEKYLSIVATNTAEGSLQTARQ